VSRIVPFVLLLSSAPSMADSAETPEARLAAAGYTLPTAAKPVANYVTSVRTGNLLFLSGHGECGSPETRGKLGAELSIEQGVRSAEKVGLCMLATSKAAVGELSRVKRFVRILGMVQATPDFKDHPKVMNGFSDLMVVAFGENGRGARSAVGVASLPSDIAVEVEATVELHDES
jgi:enamine deaminase RidA (YjgF/YER057c/UK114 family)